MAHPHQLGADRAGDAANIILRQRAGQLFVRQRPARQRPGRPLALQSTAQLRIQAGADVHVIGDSQGTSQPKSGHKTANAQARSAPTRWCATLPAGSRSGAGDGLGLLQPVTARTASWLTVMFAYDPSAPP